MLVSSTWKSQTKSPTAGDLKEEMIIFNKYLGGGTQTFIINYHFKIIPLESNHNPTVIVKRLVGNEWTE